MEEFNCAATMDDEQEGEWSEILQWHEHAFEAAHSDNHGLTVMGGSSIQQPTCTSMHNVHSSLALENLNPILIPHNHNSSGLISPRMSLSDSLLQSPRSFTLASINQLSSTSAALEAAVIDQLNSSAASLSTIDADNLTSTVRQHDESSQDNLRSPTSWFSVFLQNLHSGVNTSLASSASSYNNLLNIGDDNQQGAAAATQNTINSLYSNHEELDDMMQQMQNEFMLYGGASSLQDQPTHALRSSDQLKLESEGGACMIGSGNEEGAAQTLLCTPASSVSSDGGAEDDSDSHEDVKDSVDIPNSLEAFDEFMVPGEHCHRNVASSLRSSETLCSKAGTKVGGETSAGPSSSHDQDKKRASKSARVTKKPKRERGNKLAIKIQSETEVLDDGYKWRKYGQKAVKNSPYPRSYYKCTDKQCKVKKHVERQAHEPEYVVTTYEGQHNHSRPDQQVQVLHSQSDAASQQHDAFQAFVPTPSTHHLEMFGRSLFQPDSQPMSLPLQQTPPSSQQTLEALNQDVLEDLLHGEPRRSSI